jgi:uncharacterized SAM-binding protein YcdF (DUF218 family)
VRTVTIGCLEGNSDMLFIEDVSQLFLPMPVYVVAFILLLCLYAMRHPDTRLGRWRYWLVAVLIWSYCCTTPAVANALIGWIESRYPPPAGVVGSSASLIVVLSSGAVFSDGTAYGAKLDASAWERTYTGVKLWKQIGGTLLFVGGPTPDGKFSAAELMAAVAHDLGVPTTAVLMETKSTNTHENLLLARDLIESHGNRTWLVTSALHMRRAMAVARRLGLRMRLYPCDYRAVRLGWHAWLPNIGAPAMFADALHEIIGLSYYRIRGYAE